MLNDAQALCKQGINSYTLRVPNFLRKPRRPQPTLIMTPAGVLGLED